MAEELYVKLWRQLPTDILEENVLRWLPLLARCRLRAVCKRWNTMLVVRPEEPFLLDIPCDAAHEDQLRFCYLHSPVTNTWSHMSLLFVIDFLRGLGGYPAPCKFQIKTYCSDGGLLCLWVKVLNPNVSKSSRDNYHLLVCNPLTRSCKALPPIRNPAGHRLISDLVMHKESSGEYQIFAAASLPNDSDSPLRYSMYDSLSKHWEFVFDLNPERSHWECLEFCSAIIFKGFFYACMREFWYGTNGWVEYFIIKTYDIKNSRISRSVKIDPHPNPKHYFKARDVSFVVSNGHLLLIVQEDLCFNIMKVADFMTSDSVACVSHPRAFHWISDATFEYKNSILFTSDDDGTRRVGVHAFSWSADLEALQPITAAVNRPRLGYHWRYYRKNMKKVNFDMEAII